MCPKFAVAFACICASPALGQSFSGLGFLPGGTSSWASDISEDATTVIGDTPNQSWRWTAGSGIQGLGLLPGYTDFPRVGGVSRDGTVIIGYATNPSTARTLSYRWTSAGLAPLDGQTSNGTPGLSGNGMEAVGEGFSQSSDTAFLYTQAGGRQSLGPLLGSPNGPGAFSGAIAASYNGSVIVGYADALLPPPSITSASTPFRWTAATGMQAMLQSNGQLFRGSAQDICSDGSVIVGFQGNGSTLFRWTQQGGYQLITPFAAIHDNFSVRISGDGSTIIALNTVWTAATGPEHLTDVLTAAGCNFSGWSITGATGISYDGTVLCGEGIDPNGQREAWVATVPAPGAAVPFLALTLAPRRRR
jgi:hypothetical protein